MWFEKIKIEKEFEVLCDEKVKFEELFVNDSVMKWLMIKEIEVDVK